MVPTAEKDLSHPGRPGPNPQEPAPRQILRLRNQRRRHRPLLPAATVDQRQGPLLRGKAGTNRPEYKAPPKVRPSSPPPSTAPNASQAPPPRPTKAPPAGAHRPSAAGPPPFKAAHSAKLFTGYVGRVEKSMACIAMAATLAVRPSTLRGTSTNTPRTGYVPIVKTKYRSSGPFAIVESGGREAHRSSIMVKPQKTASSQRGLQLPRWCSTGGRW